MRKIDRAQLVSQIKRLCIEANYLIEEDILALYKQALAQEESILGKEVIREIIENTQVAKEDNLPLCQDTGIAIFFIDLGRDVYLNFDLQEAVDQGVREGYQEGYLRKSIVRDPLIERINTSDNTPAVLHLRSVPGDKMKISFIAKGCGSENMSNIKFLPPFAGVEGIRDFVIDAVRSAGPNPCPPIIIGLGIGGTFEKVAMLAKEALLRRVDSNHPIPFYDALEKRLLEEVNSLGIGPGGFGGRITALRVFIKTYPCHIASLPVAVNIQCHSMRHKEVII